MLRISNRTARWLWLETNGLARAPTGPLGVLETIKKLGFVQLDTIRIIARAHHHILWSRNQNYREPMLNTLLAEERSVFEHFTHDACVLPAEVYPHWRRQFRRIGEHIQARSWYKAMPDAAGRADIKARIALEGPLCTKAFDTKIKGKREMWKRPPHKLALDYMWYTGELSTSHRENFTKFYDLTERVIPAHLLGEERADETQIDWLCSGALERLAFGSEGEIQRFWAATSRAEVKAWAGRAANRILAVEVEAADGTWMQMLAAPDIEQRLAALTSPTSRLRILNPFDPAIRDRLRLKRLFGFDYKIEIFVPEAKRRWGYYVYPILEGDKFVGRIEVKADRKAGRLTVKQVWPEPGVRWTARRAARLDAELARMARFVGMKEVIWHCSPPIHS